MAGRFVYNYFRDYDPTTGRYTTSDPIGLRGGTNRYTYVEGNPAAKIDPDGLQSDPFGSSGGAGGYTPAPSPFDVFFPGTQANNAFVQSVNQMAKAVKDACMPKDDECAKEWQEARRVCRQLIYEQMEQQAGRRKKRSVTGVTGGFTDVEECARGLVSEQCGGNKVLK